MKLPDSNRVKRLALAVCGAAILIATASLLFDYVQKTTTTRGIRQSVAGRRGGGARGHQRSRCVRQRGQLAKRGRPLRECGDSGPPASRCWLQAGFV